MRLRAVVEHSSQESLDPAMVGMDNRCVLGQWIHGEAVQFNQMKEYTELVHEHSNFHKCAADVLRMALAGQTEKAKAQLDAEGPFMEASIHTINAIRHLRRKVEKA